MHSVHYGFGTDRLLSAFPDSPSGWHTTWYFKNSVLHKLTWIELSINLHFGSTDPKLVHLRQFLGVEGSSVRREIKVATLATPI